MMAFIVGKNSQDSKNHTEKPWAPAGIFVGGSEPQKGPPQDKKGPPQKNIVLAPFLGGSEACSPEKKLTVVLPTTLDASQHERI